MYRSLLIISILVLSCFTLKSQTRDVASWPCNEGTNPNVRGQRYEPYHALTDLKVATPKDSSLYFTVKARCAIAVIPDTSWINQQQWSIPEDEWNNIVSDQQYYQSLAIDTLEANGIKVVYQFGDRRYLKFNKNNGSDFTIDRQKKKDLWGLILFNGKDDPVRWNDTQISEALRDVFKIRSK